MLIAIASCSCVGEHPSEGADEMAPTACNSSIAAKERSCWNRCCQYFRVEVWSLLCTGCDPHHLHLSFNKVTISVVVISGCPEWACTMHWELECATKSKDYRYGQVTECTCMTASFRGGVRVMQRPASTRRDQRKKPKSVWLLPTHHTRHVKSHPKCALPQVASRQKLNGFLWFMYRWKVLERHSRMIYILT